MTEIINERASFDSDITLFDNDFNKTLPRFKKGTAAKNHLRKTVSFLSYRVVIIDDTIDSKAHTKNLKEWTDALSLILQRMYQNTTNDIFDDRYIPIDTTHMMICLVNAAVYQEYLQITHVKDISQAKPNYEDIEKELIVISLLYSNASLKKNARLDYCVNNAIMHLTSFDFQLEILDELLTLVTKSRETYLMKSTFIDELLSNIAYRSIEVPTTRPKKLSLKHKLKNMYISVKTMFKKML